MQVAYDLARDVLEVGGARYAAELLRLQPGEVFRLEKDRDGVLRPTRAVRVVQRGPLRLDLLTRVATWDLRVIPLRPKEWALLALLVANPERVLDRASIGRAIWRSEPSRNLLHRYVSLLRQKLGPTAIATVRGIGYRLSL